MMADQATLERLRGRLNDFLATTLQSGDAVIRQSYQSWREARRAFSTTLSDQILNVSELLSGPDLRSVGAGIRRRGSEWVIEDSEGRLWSMRELEEAIALRSGTARSVDPLVSQLLDIPSVETMFREHPQLARTHLRSLLTEMRSNNRVQTFRARMDPMYAFRASRIQSDLENRTVPGTDVVLQGVHLAAHELIGDSFEGSSLYGLGLDWAFGIEQGRRALIEFLEFTGTLLLSIACPPLGIAVGVTIAGVHYAGALQQEQLYESLIEPDLVMSRADVELDLFLAELELALSIIPEAGTIIRGAVRGGSMVARHGLRAAARAAGRRLTRSLVQSMARQLRHGLVVAFIRELAQDRVMDLLFQQVLGPVIEVIRREHELGAGRATLPPEASSRPHGPSAQRLELDRQMDLEGEVDHGPGEVD